MDSPAKELAEAVDKPLGNVTVSGRKHGIHTPFQSKHHQFSLCNWNYGSNFSLEHLYVPTSVCLLP